MTLDRFCGWGLIVCAFAFSLILVHTDPEPQKVRITPGCDDYDVACVLGEALQQGIRFDSQGRAYARR
jgi:hypothetical protein